MNIYKQIIKYPFTIIVLSQLSLNYTVSAASYDIFDDNKSFIIDKNGKALEEINGFPSNFKYITKNEAIKKNTDKNYIFIFKLIKENQLLIAKNKLALLLSDTPDDAQLYNLQALLETRQNNTTAAKHSYQKAISLNRNNIDAYLSLAKIYFLEGELSQSKDYVNKALSINKQPIFAYLLLAEIASKQNNNNEVEKILLSAFTIVKGNIAAETQLLTTLGRFYVNQERPKKFLSKAQDFAKRYPNKVEALSTLVSAQFANNDISSAEKTLREIVSTYTQDTKHRLVLAKLLGERPNKSKEVLRLIDETLNIEPNNLHALTFKTSYFIKAEQYKKAMATANHINTLAPTLAIGNQLKGNIYIAEKKLTEAQDAYQKAYQIEPSKKLLSSLIGLMINQGKQTSAINFLKKELEKNNRNLDVLFKLALIYQQQNDIDLAQKYYELILAEQPSNINALNNLAWLYLTQNNPKAIPTAKKAYESSGKAAAIADTYGYILIKQGKKKEGLAILEKAAESLPKVYDIQYHLAEANSINGHKQQAIKILRKITSIQENYSEKEAAFRLLKKLN